MLACCSAGASEPRVETLTTADGVEVAFQRYPATGTGLLVWWPSEHGIEQGHAEVAAQLSRSGTEVWIADPFATWFLPTLRASLSEIPRDTCGAFLHAAGARSGKRLFVLGQGRGATVLLECLRHAVRQGLQEIGGVLLVTPDLFLRTRQPGRRREFEPIASATNFPVFVIFAEKSIEHLYRDEIVAVLSEGGSRVYHTLVQGARNRFFYRPDASPLEVSAGQGLAGLLLRSMDLLSHDAAARGFAQLDARPAPKAGTPGRKLVRYTGPQHDRLRLPDLDGRIHDTRKYAGTALLVSFWASWCPPCVHELPSMVRLQTAMAGQPFRVLAVNLDETPATINAFLRARPVNFPVLLDAGLRYAQRWQVSAFPSSFLIDGTGSIRYAVAGALEWDDPVVVDTIRQLLAE